MENMDNKGLKNEGLKNIDNSNNTQIIEITEKRKRGRPKKAIDETQEPKEIKKQGRPKKYFTDEEYKKARYEAHLKTYDKRGYLIIKIK